MKHYCEEKSAVLKALGSTQEAGLSTAEAAKRFKHV